MPRGYVFVPKGSVYITANCRKQTRVAGQIVYTVVDKNKRTVGLRVPSVVHQAVLASEVATRIDRASAVQKRDEALEREFHGAVKKLFPQAPEGDVPEIVARAMKKGSGRVGRTSRIAVEAKATLAVTAHVRHCHTNYDQLLKDGHNRGKARNQTYQKINEVLQAWRGNINSKKKEKKLVSSMLKPQVGQSTKTTKQKQTIKPAKEQNPALSSKLPTMSPVERRMTKLKTWHTGSSKSTATNAVASTGRSVGQSLKDDVSDNEDSDEYVGSSDTSEWPDIDEQDSDWDV